MLPKQKLNAAEIEAFIDDHGRLVEWQESISCSCWNLDSGQPSYSCRACGGKGFVYQTPFTAKVLVTSVTLSKEYADMAGVFDVGDAVVTVPRHILVVDDTAQSAKPKLKYVDNPMYDIGQHDRLTLSDDEFKTSEILVRGESVGHNDPDTLMNEIVTRIKGISKFDTVTGAETKYTLDTDYILNKNVIEWLDGGNSPSIGEQYTVTYAHRPMYVVAATLPKPRHQDGQDLPRYVAVKYLSGAIAN